jgi:hypothetical protein
MEEELFPRLWVIDAEQTGDYPPFVFYLYDPDEAVVLSYHITADRPPDDSLVIGAIHEGGVEAAKEWVEANEPKLREVLGKQIFLGGDDDEAPV